MHAIAWYPRRAGKFDWEEVEAGDPLLRGHLLFLKFCRPGRPGAFRPTQDMPWWITTREASDFWFRVRWLVDAPWDSRLPVNGLVSPEQYDIFRRTGAIPELLPSWVHHGGVTMSPEEWTSATTKGELPYDSKKLAIRFEHVFKLQDEWTDIHEHSIPRLLEFGDPDLVHIIYSLL